MRPGQAVRIRFDGVVVKGQVWSEGAIDGTWFVALEDGRYARVTAGGHAQIVDAHGVAVEGGAGRVAAV